MGQGWTKYCTQVIWLLLIPASGQQAMVSLVRGSGEAGLSARTEHTALFGSRNEASAE